jgi:hypothetical protein
MLKWWLRLMRDMFDGWLNSSSPRYNPVLFGSSAGYFTAPKRLSNEFGGTIGAEPET